MSSQMDSPKKQTCTKCGTMRDRDDGTFLGIVPLRCAIAEQYGWECGGVAGMFEVWCPTCGQFHEPDTLCEPIEAKAGGQPE